VERTFTCFFTSNIPKLVFTRHYIKIEDAKELMKRVPDETERLKNTLLSNFISCLLNVSKAKKPVSSL